jgi:hypothetical protein
MKLDTVEDLDTAFAEAKQQVQAEYDWYEKARRRYLILSWVIRIVAVLSLVIGTILPLTQATKPIDLLGLSFSSPSQAAIACLVFAGLVLAANQVFMISATWGRYVGAMMKLGTLLKVAEFDWAIHRAALPNPVPLAEGQKAAASFKALVVNARQLVEDETSEWSAELVKAIDQLRILISEKRSTVEALANEEQKARDAAQKLASASTHGTIRVKIEGSFERLTGAIRVSAAGHTDERTVAVSTLVFSDVPSGIHKVTLVGIDGSGKSISLENAVQVGANTIADVSLTVPKG